MTDREMLELAAKAALRAGLNVRMADEFGHDGIDKIHAVILDATGQRIIAVWSPLDDDGDAFRLGVKLGLIIKTNDRLTNDGQQCSIVCKDHYSYPSGIVAHADNKEAATRRAIVIAAAEIGKAMP